VYFNTAYPGAYNAAVKLKGKHIKGSPFEITVLQKLRYKAMHKPVLTFESEGCADGQLSGPFAVCTNDRGDFLIADSRNHRIQVFDNRGRFLLKFDTKGSGQGQLNTPCGLAIDRTRGHIIVADAGNNRIQIFDNKGSPVSAVGSKGSGEGQFNRPWGVAVDEAGNFAVADFDNHRIQVFNSDGVFVDSLCFAI